MEGNQTDECIHRQNCGGGVSLFDLRPVSDTTIYPILTIPGSNEDAAFQVRPKIRAHWELIPALTNCRYRARPAARNNNTALTHDACLFGEILELLIP